MEDTYSKEYSLDEMEKHESENNFQRKETMFTEMETTSKVKTKRTNPWIAGLILLLIGLLFFIIPAVILLSTQVHNRNYKTISTLYLTGFISFSFVLLSLIYFFFLIISFLTTPVGTFFGIKKTACFHFVLRLEKTVFFLTFTIYFLISSIVLKNQKIEDFLIWLGIGDLKVLLGVGKNTEKKLNIVFFELFLLFLLLFITKYVACQVSQNYYMKAIEKKVAECNRTAEILRRMFYESEKKHESGTLSTLKQLGLLFEEEDGLNVRTEEEALFIGKKIFYKLVPKGKNYITVEDIKNIFEDDGSNVIFAIGCGRNGHLREKTLGNYVVSYLRKRFSAKKGIETGKKLSGVFEFYLTFFVFIFATTIMAWFMSDIFFIIMLAISILLCFTLLICNQIVVTFLKSFIFVFFQHPFDCGDYITIINEDFYVKEVSVLHTELVSSENHLHKQYTNIFLSKISITNNTRSLAFMDKREICFKKVDLRRIEEFRRSLTEHVMENEADFTGYVGIDYYEYLSNSIKIVFSVEHVDNIKDYESKCERKRKLNELIQISIDRTGLELNC